MAPLTCEPILLLEQDLERGQRHQLAGGEAVAFTARKPGREGPNEDAAALIPVNGGACVLAVADGLGGAPAGATAASLAVRALRDTLVAYQGAEAGELRAAILDGFERASAAVQGLGVGADTTLAAVAVEGGTVRSVHVGDSAVMVVGQRGRVKLQTMSHSPVGYAVEAGLLDEQEAMHHADRHFVTNTVGSADMRIEVGPPMSLAPRDTLVVGSDGLFDNLYPDEIVERIRKGPLERAAERLARGSLARMQTDSCEVPSKADDLTFILYRQAVRRRAAAGLRG
jgi:serine/threonine protein phosphatase PrpC